MSKIFVDQVDPKTGTSLTLGTSGDTVNIPSGVTLANAGTMTGVPAPTSGVAASAIDSGTIATARLGSGTASSSTFLRGDQTYATAGGDNTPMFSVRQTGTVNVSDNTYTKVAWNSELVDTDNAFASDKFTVPSGKAGKYFLYVMLLGQGDNNNTMNVYYLNIYKNGSRIAMNEGDYRSYAIRKATQTVTTVQDLAVGDYLEVYVGIDVSSGVQASYSGGDYQGMFGGYKLIT